MGSNRELGIELTAEDNASKVIKDVAEAVEGLSDEATVEVEAETREAESRIGRFARELEDLNLDSAKELRIEFRAEALQGEIRRILRNLETLEDPVEVQAKLRDLERARGELEELATLAQRDYEVEIDVDPKRNAQRAVGDLDQVRDRGEGLQSAIPAIRGFGDELGGAAQGAGIASQAVADLGDFALIAGERFAGEGSRIQGVATKLGTALGAAGLAGAIGGIAFELGSNLLPRFRDWITSSSDAQLSQEELAESVRGVAAAIREGRIEEAVSKFLEQNDELVERAAEFGITAEELASVVFGLTSNLSGLASDGVDTASDSFLSFRRDVAGVESELATSASTLRDYDAASRAVADGLDSSQSVLRGYADAAEDAAEESGQWEGAAYDLAGAIAEAEEETADAAATTYDLAAAVEAATTAQRAAVDAQFALRDAQADLVEELATYQEELAETEDGSLDYQRVLDDVTEAAARQADAVVKVAEEQAEASGETLTLTQRQDIFARSLLDAARAASGPARTAILDYATAVRDIPPEVVTEIEAALDRGDVEEAERLLNVTARDREAEIDVQTRGVKSAENVLSNLVRDRIQRILVRTVPSGGSSGGGIGGGIGGISLTDSGTPRALASPVEATEGPAQLNGQTVPTYKSRDLAPIVIDARPRREAAPLTVNVQTTADMRQVDAAIRRWRRINGTGRK